MTYVYFSSIAVKRDKHSSRIAAPEYSWQPEIGLKN